MTDKQIIIHGVDVSGCVNRNNFKLVSYDCYLKGGCQCKENSNCYYKQLKRLEELLPDINGKFYKAMDDLKAKEQECEKLRFPMKDTNYALLTKEEFEEYNQLKAELKDFQDDCEGCSTCDKALYNAHLYAKECSQLKQTLAEIKEIINEFAKEDILTFPDFSKEQNYKLIQKQCGEPILKILEKINECEIINE